MPTTVRQRDPLMRTVRESYPTGRAAIHIEDRSFPSVRPRGRTPRDPLTKRCSLARRPGAPRPAILTSSSSRARTPRRRGGNLYEAITLANRTSTRAPISPCGGPSRWTGARVCREVRGPLFYNQPGCTQACLSRCASWHRAPSCPAPPFAPPSPPLRSRAASARARARWRRRIHRTLQADPLATCNLCRLRPHPAGRGVSAPGELEKYAHSVGHQPNAPFAAIAWRTMSQYLAAARGAEGPCGQTLCTSTATPCTRAPRDALRRAAGVPTGRRPE